jgi:segregation and condensation protein A
LSDFDDAFADIEGAASPDEALVVAVDGFEGPLDLLLTLARNQKVDLAKISVLELAEQYLGFVESARVRNLELAADYLVMAAWLAYLKSRLLLPQATPEDETPAHEMAELLRLRLQRLQAIREAGVRLMARNQLGREIFVRGMPEPVEVVRLQEQIDSLYDLLTAYSRERLKRVAAKAYKPGHAPVLLIEEARERLERMLGRIGNCNGLTRLLPAEWAFGERRRSGVASTLLACLELARDGKIEMRQLQPFDEIYVRDRGDREDAETM